MNNCLKLVYDNWENDTPLPNGTTNTIGIPEYLFVIPHQIIQSLNNSNIQIQNIKLEDADENSYYIVNHRCSFEYTFGLKKWCISNDVEQKIKNKNLKVIFLSEHESFDNIEIHLKNLQTLIVSKNLKEENFYLLNNNSCLYDIKNKIKTNINVFKTNFLIELIACADVDNMGFVKNKKFTFLLYNRTPKPHRTALLILLKKLELLKDDIIDWSLLYPIIGHPFDATFIDKTFIDINSKEIRPIYKEFLNITKLSYFETDKDWFDNYASHNVIKHNEIQSFEQSYVNIVTESYFDEIDIHISEKTYKAFYFLQLPIFLANYNFVKKLREQHPELYLFDDLINHDYDNELDNNKRLMMVVNEIKRLSEMKDVIQQYYINNKLKIIQNQDYIKKYKNNKTTINFFKSLIY